MNYVHSASGCVIFPFEFLRVKETGPAQGWGRVQRPGLETWRSEGYGVPYLAGVLAFIPSAVFCGAPLHGDTAMAVLAIFCKGLEGKHLSSVAPQPVMAAVVAVGGAVKTDRFPSSTTMAVLTPQVAQLERPWL